jgi:hypothetical protein
MNGGEVKVPTNDSEWEALIAAWIATEESGKRTSDYDPAWWAVDTVGEWHLDDLHESLWEFIVRALNGKCRTRLSRFSAPVRWKISSGGLALCTSVSFPSSAQF